MLNSIEFCLAASVIKHFSLHFHKEIPDLLYQSIARGLCVLFKCQAVDGFERV